MVEGVNSRRGITSRAISCHCCGRGYGNRSRRCSLDGRPGADTYDNLCSLSDSLSHSQPHSHRHAYAYAHARAYALADPHANADPNADTNANANANTDPDAHPDARLQHSIPKLGMAILRCRLAGRDSGGGGGA